MKIFRFAIVLVAVSLAAARCTSTTRPGGAASAANPMANVSSMLSGIFRGSTPGNDLTLNIQNVGFASTTNAFDFSVTTSGRYQGTNTRDEGLLHVENQGDNVSLTYLPHFDPTVGSLSREATRFSREELESACNLILAPSGDGYAGETPGTTACARAIPGAVGKWTVEVEPGSIRLRNAGSGETLRFQRGR